MRPWASALTRAPLIASREGAAVAKVEMEGRPPRRPQRRRSRPTCHCEKARSAGRRGNPSRTRSNAQANQLDRHVAALLAMTNRVGGPLWEERDDHTWASALARAPRIASRVGRVLRTSRALSLKRNSNRLVRDDSPYLLPLMFRRQLRTQALDLKIARRSARSRALRRLPHAKYVECAKVRGPRPVDGELVAPRSFRRNPPM